MIATLHADAAVTPRADGTMAAILALFPGDDDAIVMCQAGGSCSGHHSYLAAWGVTSPGLWRLDWPEDEDAPPVAVKLADLPPIPDLESP